MGCVLFYGSRLGPHTYRAIGRLSINIESLWAAVKTERTNLALASDGTSELLRSIRFLFLSNPSYLWSSSLSRPSRKSSASTHFAENPGSSFVICILPVDAVQFQVVTGGSLELLTHPTKRALESFVRLC